jgi:hypothetical protein
MRDNLRRYRAIRDALTQGYPSQPPGRVARHVTTLAALISGLVGRKSTPLPSVAPKIPEGPKPESRVKRLTRWLDNARILEAVSLLPSVDIFLTQLAIETLVVVMDGSVVGRGCLALMRHVVEKGRALPLAWRVRHSPQGHGPEDLHMAVVALMSTVIPAGAKVVFLGDGAFDGTALQDTLREMGWSSVCRTAMSTTAPWEGASLRRDALGTCIQPGKRIEFKEVSRTREAYGPIIVLCGWAKGSQEPLYLVSNLATAEEACRLYHKRFRIETLFSDQKSRGLHMPKSHIADPQRLSRLCIATWLAYIWIVYFGALGEKAGWQEIIHRRKRCDCSLFQLGLRILEHFLNEELPIPVQFHVTI